MSGHAYDLAVMDELWTLAWMEWATVTRAKLDQARAERAELESITAAGLAAWDNDRHNHMSFCQPHGSPRSPSASFARVTIKN